MINLETCSREELTHHTFKRAVEKYRAMLRPDEPSLMEIRDLMKYSIQAVDAKFSSCGLGYEFDTALETVARFLWHEYGINLEQIRIEYSGTDKRPSDLIRLWHQVTHKP